MTSAITFRPGKYAVPDIEAICSFYEACALLAEETGQEIGVLAQHNLKEDVFVVLVEFPRHSLGFYDKHPIKVFKKLTRKLYDYLRDFDEEHQAKERSSRTKSRRINRRARSTRKWSAGVLQRRRTKAGRA